MYSLFGQEYLETIRERRDQALEESNWLGKRKKLGKFTYGTACAEWETEDGGRAKLTDTGLRYGEEPIVFFTSSTELKIFESKDNGLFLTHFDMHLEDSLGSIHVFRTIIERGTMREVLKAELARRQEQAYDLHQAEASDRQLLLDELGRGASGLYVPRYYEEDVE
jgi:hypothetical protein